MRALYPEAAQRWSGNNDIDPDQILPSLSYEKLWICGTCHGEYSAPVRDVVAGTDECPYCKGTRVLPGYNSFADKHPDLMEELDTKLHYSQTLHSRCILYQLSSPLRACCSSGSLGFHLHFRTIDDNLLLVSLCRNTCGVIVSKSTRLKRSALLVKASKRMKEIRIRKIIFTKWKWNFPVCFRNGKRKDNCASFDKNEVVQIVKL